MDGSDVDAIVDAVFSTPLWETAAGRPSRFIAVPRQPAG
jgi:hypothetical protein